MDLLASYDDDTPDTSEHASPKQDPANPASTALENEWLSFEQMIAPGGGGASSGAGDSNSYLVDGVVAYPGMKAAPTTGMADVVQSSESSSSDDENDTNEAMPDTETKPVNEEEDDAFFMMRKVSRKLISTRDVVFKSCEAMPSSRGLLICYTCKSEPDKKVKERDYSSSSDGSSDSSSTSSSRSASPEKGSPSPPHLSPVNSVKSHESDPPDLFRAESTEILPPEQEHKEEKEEVKETDQEAVKKNEEEEKTTVAKPTSDAPEKKRSGSRERKRSHRDRSRSKHREHGSSSRSKRRRSRSRSKERKHRHGSRDRDRHRHRDKKRHSSKERKPSRSRDKKRSKSRERKGHERKRSRSREAKPSKGRERKSSRAENGEKRRSRSRDRDRDRKEKKKESRNRRRSKSKERKQNRSKDRRRKGRSRSRSKHRNSRSRSRERLRSRSPVLGRKLTFKEQMRKDILTASKINQQEKVEVEMPAKRPGEPLKPSDLLKGIKINSGESVTPQMALMQTMAAMHKKAQELTGVEVPKYYNPAAVNPLKYAEQVQKRKLLWAKKDDNKQQKEKDEQIETQWKSAFISEDDGKTASKFRKLMGMKGADTEVVSTGEELSKMSEEQRNKQNELFQRLDQEYQFARITTHTQRGVGFGFSSQVYDPNHPANPPP